MKTKVILAATKKEAAEIAKKNYINPIFERVYKYSRGKGNNFYQFQTQ